MSKIKMLIILGTRPEAIKLAPVITALRHETTLFEIKVCDTEQHTALKQPILDFFQIQPDYRLNALSASQNLSSLTAYLLQALPAVFEDFLPDWILVQGDTTSALAGSLSAFYHKIKIAHLEAGLRTHNKWSPFPEEMNRKIISSLADLHFAPTLLAKENLIAEGIPATQIHVIGNTVIDALQFTLQKIQEKEIISIHHLKNQIKPWREKYLKMILFTLHRRENLEQHLMEIGQAVEQILQQNDCFILFPVHLNPSVRQWSREVAAKCSNLILTAPLPYETFVWAMQTCDLILTDSGGIQEEAPTLRKPVIVLRDKTERPEAQQIGTIHQLSIDSQVITRTVFDVLNQKTSQNMLPNPFGDGKSAERIVTIFRQLIPDSISNK